MIITTKLDIWRNAASKIQLPRHNYVYDMGNNITELAGPSGGLSSNVRRRINAMHTTLYGENRSNKLSLAGSLSALKQL